MRTYFLAVAGLLAGLGLVCEVHASDLAWTRYTNDRFGASAEIPRTLFLPETAPDNNDGQSFRAPNESATVLIYGSLYTSTSDSFSAYRDTIMGYARQDGIDLTYKRSGTDFFVYSGLKGDKVVYEKTIKGCKDVADTIRIEYPAASKSTYDPLIGRMAGSLAARGGYECK